MPMMIPSMISAPSLGRNPALRSIATAVAMVPFLLTEQPDSKQPTTNAAQNSLDAERGTLELSERHEMQRAPLERQLPLALAGDPHHLVRVRRHVDLQVHVALAHPLVEAHVERLEGALRNLAHDPAAHDVRARSVVGLLRLAHEQHVLRPNA